MKWPVCYMHTGLLCSIVHSIIHGNFVPWMLYAVVVPHLWAAMPMDVPPVAICASAIIVAVIVIAPNARVDSGKHGYRQGKTNCCLCPTSILCSHCLTPETSSVCLSRIYFMPCCLKQHGAYLTALGMMLNY